jgi:hypothetical protein
MRPDRAQGKGEVMLLGTIQKSVVNSARSQIFCTLPASHPDTVEIYDRGYCLETQTGHVLSHNAHEAKIMLEGHGVYHDAGRGKPNEKVYLSAAMSPVHA